MPQSPKNSGPSQSGGGESFLERWSNRKARSAEQPPFNQSTDADTAQTETAANPAGSTGDPSGQQAENNPPPPVTEADLENLTYESDYTKFMGEQVPEALRRRALRQLWRSDPILANVDGLCDYDDDYTDAALAVKVLQTAHKVGQGYLTDEEVAANRARGKTKPADDKAATAENVSSETEGAHAASPDDVELADAGDSTSSDAELAPANAQTRQEAAQAANFKTEAAGGNTSSATPDAQLDQVTAGDPTKRG